MYMKLVWAYTIREVTVHEQNNEYDELHGGESGICEKIAGIDYKLYDEYGVKKGLRDKNGMGVLAGITNISHIQAYDTNENGEKVPCEGKLLYRGYNVNDLVRGFVEEKRFGFE